MKNLPELKKSFVAAAEVVGAQVVDCKGLKQAVDYLVERVDGSLLCPTFVSGEKNGLADKLKKAGLKVVTEDFRNQAASAQAGITGVNFAMADTGTLALESTAEDIRLATTLPEVHFALLDPAKIYADSLEAVEPLRQLHQRDPRNYIAYITGPSRTADIERVLTIGVHGPKELHILLVPKLSNDPLEM
ncbi:L-lactate dehydrogenase complex protein LldG [Malonomonas rubra DSM 5091]|uniref:L-lactate dehydrogenase complex protein LldG n=1 Tax=Malonomonas rubra DSM 5091 TaxID=1122189 RepID=A0A1M6FDF4_MALRU|nr:lactate utilization protein [Malonomonas rubra]SHI95683.1 L-lactate dehydrogenase complex protein LldG [Malonomonas rubra DSM 5091]